MTSKSKRATRPRRRIQLIEHILNASTRLTPVKAQPSKRMRRRPEQIRGSEARAVRTRGRRIYTGAHPLSSLDGKMLVGEAAIEQDFWVVVDFIYPNLANASAQPFELDIEFLGEIRKWTPDALLTLADGTQILVETKPLKELQPGTEAGDEDSDDDADDDEPAAQWADQLEPGTPAYARARLDAWTQAADALGLKFLAMSEVEVRTEPRFYNAQVMHRAMGAPLPETERDMALAFLAGGPETLTVAELSEHLGQYAPSALLFACWFDRLGYVRLDRTDFFSPRSRMINLLGQAGREPDEAAP